MSGRPNPPTTLTMATQLMVVHEDVGPEQSPGINWERTSLRRSRSRRKRKMQENEEKRRIRGDSHWSKVHQVNSDTSRLNHRRCLYFCKTFHFRETVGCSPSFRFGRSQKGNEKGLISNLSTRIRQWLQSKRKYEVSPLTDASGDRKAHCDSNYELTQERSLNGRHGSRLPQAEAIKEDYLIISQVNSYHPELRRSEATNPLGENISKSTSIHTFAKTSGYPSNNSGVKGIGWDKFTHDSQHPVVDINVEYADHSVPTKTRSHFSINPLKLDQQQVANTDTITPATRALSRSQQLRQSRNKYMKLMQKAGQLSPGRSPLTGTISAPAKHDIGSKGPSPTIKRRQIKTWPLPSRKMLHPADDDDPCVCDSETELPFIQEMNFDKFGLRGKSSLKDFSIEFKDLSLGDLSKKGRRCKLYKGRWHGDVIVHVFGELRQKDKEAFWANLGKLCRIRHENIILFMAACTNEPNLAVVTCNPQGKSLYEHIHVQREKMNMHSKVQVLHQIALGMGYLHAKGIVLRKLNTKNVFLGHKVKVSALDCGFLDSSHDRPNYGSIPAGHLTYIAPEIMCTIRVIPPRLTPGASYTPETDVFAFGTIMYEVLAGRFPFQGVLSEKIIWQVCSGHRQILYTLECSTAIKTLIEDCWAHEPLYRPEFRELCKDLQRHSPHHKKISSSEPRLNRGWTSPLYYDIKQQQSQPGR